MRPCRSLDGSYFEPLLTLGILRKLLMVSPVGLKGYRLLEIRRKGRDLAQRVTVISAEVGYSLKFFRAEETVDLGKIRMRVL